MDPGRRCLVSEWSPFSEGSLLGGHVSDQQLLAAWWDGREVSAMSSCVHVCPWGGLENWLWAYISMCAWSVTNYGKARPAQQFPEAAIFLPCVFSQRESRASVCVYVCKMSGEENLWGEDYHLAVPPHLFISIEGGTSGARFGVELSWLM